MNLFSDKWLYSHWLRLRLLFSDLLTEESFANIKRNASKLMLLLSIVKSLRYYQYPVSLLDFGNFSKKIFKCLTTETDRCYFQRHFPACFSFSAMKHFTFNEEKWRDGYWWMKSQQLKQKYNDLKAGTVTQKSSKSNIDPNYKVLLFQNWGQLLLK